MESEESLNTVAVNIAGKLPTLGNSQGHSVKVVKCCHFVALICLRYQENKILPCKKKKKKLTAHLSPENLRKELNMEILT